MVSERVRQCCRGSICNETAAADCFLSLFSYKEELCGESSMRFRCHDYRVRSSMFVHLNIMIEILLQKIEVSMREKKQYNKEGKCIYLQKIKRGAKPKQTCSNRGGASRVREEFVLRLEVQ